MPGRPFEYPWPTPSGASDSPEWLGRGFRLGDERVSVLSYQIGDSGWTDELTAFHEDTAGSNHPIDRASRELALEPLGALRARTPVLLEIGCSSGFMLRLLRRRLPDAFVIGADYVRGPLEELAGSLPDVPLLQFDLTTCPLPDRSVDAVIMLNVLEHIEDDAGALDQVQRVLRPGGLLILEVPAGPNLYDVYDELLLHHRRYAMSGLRRLVQSSGLEIVRATHLGVLLYPVFAAVKLRNKRFLSRERALQRRVVEQNIRTTGSSALLGAALGLERALGRRLRWPFGIRCILAARKPRSGRPANIPYGRQAAPSRGT
ncbi:MAG: methyltransferase domain-containing protein [Chloroflexi bacterium]|nr:methyltransferase domain-containing protein [Chloroflexota bacterium]